MRSLCSLQNIYKPFSQNNELRKVSVCPTKRAADSPKAGEKSAKRKVVKSKVIRPQTTNANRSAASLPAEYNKKMTTPEEKIVRLYWVLEKMYWLERLEEAVCQLESEIAAEHSVQADTPLAMDSRAILINTACS